MPAWRNILRKHGGDKAIGHVNVELGAMILDATSIVFLSRSGFYEGRPFYWTIFGDRFGIAHNAYGETQSRAGELRHESTLGNYPNVPAEAAAIWPDAREAFANAVASITTAGYRRAP